MLTKDLLHYHISGKRIKVDFIDPSDPRLLQFAAKLISLYEENLSLRRRDLEELVKLEINSKRDLKLAKGIGKVLDDRSEYSLSGTVPFSELREKLFAASASVIQKGDLPEDMDKIRENVLQKFLAEFPGREIYGDLPENEVLLKVKKTFPKELLERYNMELVRSLLLYSSRMEIRTEASQVQDIRKIFQYLKFFRLLCKAVSLPGKNREKKESFSFMIDGPASLLDNSVKYGLLLANFFPVICKCKHWEMQAVIQLGGEGKKEYLLKLDETSHLKCHYENMGTYMPEEIRMFAEFFNEKSPVWRLGERAAWRKLPGGENVFPDFAFSDPLSGQVFELEIFHPWHKNHIEERLQYIEKGLLPHYLLAVEKSCIKKDPVLSERLSSSPFVLLFSNFPGVENVCRFLDKAAAGEVL